MYKKGKKYKKGKLYKNILKGKIYMYKGKKEKNYKNLKDRKTILIKKCAAAVKKI